MILPPDQLAWWAVHKYVNVPGARFPAGFVLSLFYLCAFQLYSLPSVCGYTWCSYFLSCDKDHRPMWLECELVFGRSRIWLAVPHYCEEQSAQNGIEPSFLVTERFLNTICANIFSISLCHVGPERRWAVVVVNPHLHACVGMFFHTLRWRSIQFRFPH